MSNMREVRGESLMNMIEALILRGAEARVGKRRVHVVWEDERGRALISMTRWQWLEYTHAGRPMPAAVKEGLE